MCDTFASQPQHEEVPIKEIFISDMSSCASGAAGSAAGAAAKIAIEQLANPTDPTQAAEQRLAQYAANKRMIGSDSTTIRYRVIETKLIKSMMDCCKKCGKKADRKGGVWVVYVTPEQGRTTAARFIMHGEHLYRPNRALLIDACGEEDLAGSLCEKKQVCAGVEKSSVPRLLCESLAAKGGNVERTSSNSIFSASTDHVDDGDEDEGGAEIQKKGDENLASRQLIKLFDTNNNKKQPQFMGPRPTAKPILVIDGLNKDTTENRAFVEKLAGRASPLKVVVFVFTSNMDLASELIKKENIHLLNENGDNQDMRCTHEELVAMIRPMCRKNKINPADIVPDGYTPANSKKIITPLGVFEKLEDLIDERAIATTGSMH